jgi:putative NIF3 family GTP cyclohydrolase 1 type 2
MTIQEIYDLAIEMGMKADPRGYDRVKEILKKLESSYQELPEKKKKYFDKESLTNPYSDSRLLTGDPKKEVRKILAGIDASGTEVLLADNLNQKGAAIDLIISHHPDGNAFAALHEVMDLQVEMYAKAGIPINVADAIMKKRMDEIKLRLHPGNHARSVDTAKLLDIPLMALHTIWDNLGDHFLKGQLLTREYDTVGEVYDAMMEIPEFIEAEKGKAGPHIVSGSPKNRAGRVVIFFTGGTNPSKEMYVEMAKANIGTVIDMHMPKDAIDEMQKLHINVINAGHMSGDSIGANIFFDEIEKRGVEVIPCSGLIRVKRNK